MPNLDKTGPNGKGPKTGRKLGVCEGAEPDTMQTQGRGRRPIRAGRGRGQALRGR